MKAQGGTTAVVEREGRGRGRHFLAACTCYYRFAVDFTVLAANRVLTEREIGEPEAFVEKGVRVILAGLGVATQQ
jgi:hypothetical protein